MRKPIHRLLSAGVMTAMLAAPPIVMAKNAGSTAGQVGAGLCSAGFAGFIAGIVGGYLPGTLTWTTPATC